jgi:hypothetical protein
VNPLGEHRLQGSRISLEALRRDLGRLAGKAMFAASMKAFLFVSALLTSIAGISTHADAQNYPWCAYSSAMGGATNCGFTTFQQCMTYVSGNRGFCARAIRNTFPLRAVVIVKGTSKISSNLPCVPVVSQSVRAGSARGLIDMAVHAKASRRGDTR